MPTETETCLAGTRAADERLELESHQARNPTLRDYAGVAIAYPIYPVMVTLMLGGSVFTASKALPDLLSIGGAIWLLLTAFLVGMALVALDEFECVANPDHACIECRRIDDKYGGRGHA